MKKAMKRWLITSSFVMFISAVLFAFGGCQTQSPHFRPDELSSPTNLDVCINVSKQDEASYTLSWEPMKNAIGYSVSVNNKTVRVTDSELDITKYLTIGKENKVAVRAEG